MLKTRRLRSAGPADVCPTGCAPVSEQRVGYCFVSQLDKALFFTDGFSSFFFLDTNDMFNFSFTMP